MVQINQILVLSQPEFVRQQVENAMSSPRLRFWKRGAAK
jgi:hypothetical protein